MNRRKILFAVGSLLIAPALLLAAPPQKKPQLDCEDCKKCGPLCKCDCSKGCKCREGCCRPPRSHQSGPQHGSRSHRSRGGDYQHSRGKSYQPSRGRGHNPHPRYRGRPNSTPSRGRPSSDRYSRYKEVISKFDKNKDGKLDEKERDALKQYIQRKRD